MPAQEAAPPLHVGTERVPSGWTYTVRSTRVPAGQCLGDRIVLQKSGFPSCRAAEIAGLAAGRSFAEGEVATGRVAQAQPVHLVDEFVLPLQATPGQRMPGRRKQA